MFLFVIMFLGVDSTRGRRPEATKFQKPLALILGVVALVEILIPVRSHQMGKRPAQGRRPALNGPGQNVQKLGQAIYTGYLLPFEMTAALLVIAVASSGRAVTTPAAERERALVGRAGEPGLGRRGVPRP